MLNGLYNVVACYIAPNSILVFCSRSCFFLRSLQVSLNAQGKSVSVCPLALSEMMFWIDDIPSFHVSPWLFSNVAQCGHLGIAICKSQKIYFCRRMCCIKKNHSEVSIWTIFLKKCFLQISTLKIWPILAPPLQKELSYLIQMQAPYSIWSSVKNQIWKNYYFGRKITLLVAYS